MFRSFVVSLAVFCSVASVFSQAPRRVDSRHTHQRILVRVPVVGSGVPGDPRRPAYAPLPPVRGVRTPALTTGIIAFTAQYSDDGKFALVEFVARDRSAFKQLLADVRSEVKIFEKSARKADIEADFKKYKKTFELDKMGVRLP